MSKSKRGPGVSTFDTDREQRATPTESALAEAFLHDILERDPDVCNHCLGLREETECHFRNVGGCKDVLTDRFCDCGHGTGKESAVVDLHNGKPHTTPRYESQAAGTAGREWGGLPIRGSERVTFASVLRNAVERLRERGYPVEWEVARDIGMSRKKEHPGRDRDVLAATLWTVLDEEMRRVYRLERERSEN